MCVLFLFWECRFSGMDSTVRRSSDGHSPQKTWICMEKKLSQSQKWPISPFVISAEGVDYDIHQVLKETSIEPDIRFSSMDDHVVISMVANNLGISMLPNLVIGNARAQIQALPLEPNFSRELGIGIRSYAGLSPAAQQFIATIQEHINTF